MGQAQHLGCDLQLVVSQIWRDERFECSAIYPKGGEANMCATYWRDMTVLPR